ncbi:hypothetical protein BGZ95_011429 [Linnemannia exigua]|uniref:Agmatine deiminase n=1 Tax=Linnemannia exigua TaxID=604196 RepID=A0AAD4DLZ4_9FUNG|nr:hypothetical protein BGZ95_011429 [Linnemannia exigua]
MFLTTTTAAASTASRVLLSRSIRTTTTTASTSFNNNLSFKKHLFAHSLSRRASPTAAMTTTTTSNSNATPWDPQGRRIPAEWEPHQRVMMAWPTHWHTLTPKFQGDVARVAQAVSRFENVQMLVHPELLDQAREAVGKGGEGKGGVEFLEIPVNDLWARDFIPLFMTRPKDGGGHGGKQERELVGVDFNFNGYGQRAPYELSTRASERLLKHWNNTSRLVSQMVAEGGAIESDGEGTLMMTESSIVNDNRNPNKTRADLEEMFKQELGVKKVIWLKGLKAYDSTDSHVDALARFVAPGVVMISKPPPESETQNLLHSHRFHLWREQYAQAIQVLSTTTDASGRSIRIIDLPEPTPSKTRRIPVNEVSVFEDIGVEECEKDGSGGINTYMNFLMANGGIVMPEFGDKEADQEAKRIVEEFFKEDQAIAVGGKREVVTVRIDYLVKGGGGIHCSTHDVPVV